MPADAPTDSLPDPSPLTAYLVASPAADAIAFYAEAFGAEEILRFEDPSGLIMHAQLRLNGADLMLSDEMEQMGALAPQRLGGSPASLHLYTEDADAAFEKAVAAGAKALRAPSDQF
ncbi:MAG: VOC family protein, partial [Pseudomonadota bacterium]